MTLAKLALAYEFAGIAHAKQRRKGNGEAYVNHPIRVARILADQGASIETVIAAILHDSVEDSTLTIAQVQEKFGNLPALIVQGVTDEDSIAHLPRQERKARQAEKYKYARLEVKHVKLADQTDNLESLLATLESRPAADAACYAQSMIMVARACGDVDLALLSRAEKAFSDIMDALN
jgi:guanosine-3',5'-bis(diphosphate) 3'-pyrophosphohydrolase